MVTTVTNLEVLKFSESIIAGMFANPTIGNITTDSYARQQIISQTIQDTINAFVSIGIQITEDKI